ncbi:MAG: rhodanese-like domain-containing protein [Gemmatimonadales bacterium]|nr:MAG: rhodanese-like domain-containing protein [Gemmatimonadales bacterium]
MPTPSPGPFGTGAGILRAWRQPDGPPAAGWTDTGGRPPGRRKRWRAGSEARRRGPHRESDSPGARARAPAREASPGARRGACTPPAIPHVLLSFSPGGPVGARPHPQLERIMTSRSPQAPEIPEMTPTELRDRLEQEQPLVLVDVREPHEREIADLPESGQHRIPVGEFEARIQELDPDDAVVLYCRSGARSMWAAKQLAARGFEQVWNLKGGVLGWRDEVDPSLEAY